MECNPKKTSKTVDIAIVGAGVAGVTIATHIARNTNANVTVIEKSDSLVSGPPFCHLHAGGNLYREIDIEQCKQLLLESVETLKLYPDCANVRPTVIAIPTRDDGNVDELLPRLRQLQRFYQQLVSDDPNNQVLGEPDDYFRLYSRTELEALKQRTQSHAPKQLDDWMIPVAYHLDFSKVKWPLVVVQEYGLSLFRVAATAEGRIEQADNCHIELNQKVMAVTQNPSQPQCERKKWVVTTESGRTFEADYLVNACGYRSGELDDQVGVPAQRLVEFKAAYLAHWRDNNYWPEMIFHGTRGTPNGMAQFTPYANGLFQLHGMTNNITLFEDGIAQSNGVSAQPRLANAFQHKLNGGWHPDLIDQRTSNAIEFLAHFLPEFANAEVSSKPMFGAQQVPGDDLTLRAAGVTIAKSGYARAEIVKATSAIPAAKAIEHDLIQNHGLQPSHNGVTNGYNKAALVIRSVEMALERGYPQELAMPWPNLSATVVPPTNCDNCPLSEALEV